MKLVTDMNVIATLLLVLLANLQVTAQVKEETSVPLPSPTEISPVENNYPNEPELIDFPDQAAEFPGGSTALNKWINQNLRYPEISREQDDQGRIFVSFIVEIDGSISAVDVMRGGVTPELNNEAKRLVRTMPLWIPAEAHGKPVRSRNRLPFTFVIN